MHPRALILRCDTCIRVYRMSLKSLNERAHVHCAVTPWAVAQIHKCDTSHRQGACWCDLRTRGEGGGGPGIVATLVQATLSPQQHLEQARQVRLSDLRPRHLLQPCYPYPATQTLLYKPVQTYMPMRGIFLPRTAAHATYVTMLAIFGDPGITCSYARQHAARRIAQAPAGCGGAEGWGRPRTRDWLARMALLSSLAVFWRCEMSSRSAMGAAVASSKASSATVRSARPPLRHEPRHRF